MLIIFKRTNPTIRAESAPKPSGSTPVTLSLVVLAFYFDLVAPFPSPLILEPSLSKAGQLGYPGFNSVS